MSNLRQAAEQALKAIETVFMPFHPAVIDLRAALAEPEERQTITPKELAASLKRGEKWIVIEENP